MKRKIEAALMKWLSDSQRKPLILRGARQVGKTWAIRHLAEEANMDLVEINFEKTPELRGLFDSNDPTTILSQLEIALNRTIEKDKAILFLDEIQAASELLSKLRWFYEEMPDLAVVAAGSLLEFALAEHDYSMPVGRVTYMFMGPMSFAEFLWAKGEDKLADYLASEVAQGEMPEVIHKKAYALFREYFVVGGMPDAVKNWAEVKSIHSVTQIQTDLIQTYRDDFNKYRKRIDPEVLRRVMVSSVKQLGQRFVYTNIGLDERQPKLKSALNMLTLAGLCTRSTRTSANGLPLGAEADDGLFKLVFLDTGLALNMMGYRPATEEEFQEMAWANKGALAEQVVGQLLISAQKPNESSLYYWQQSGSGTGEIDYLLPYKGKVLPIEVKAGTSGSMKSLHAFMASKHLDLALRFDGNKPSVMNVDVLTTHGEPSRYKLVSLPLYMAEFWQEWMPCGGSTAKQSNA